MKRVVLSTMTMAMIYLMALMVASCSHDMDVFDYHVKVNQYVQSWNDSINEIIDPTHTWNTTREAELTVTANKPGILRILTASAFNGEEGRAMLYKKSIKDGETLTFKIAVPQELDTIYSALYDSNGYIEELPVIVEGGKATIDYESAYKPSAAKVRSVESHNSSNDGWDFTKEDAFGTYATAVPSDATYITEGGGGVYYIDREANEYKFNSTSTIYIKKGDYTFRSIYIADNSKVYLLPGANVKAVNGFCSQSGVKIFIAEGASLEMTSNSTTRTGAYIFCRGKFKVKDLEFWGNGTIYVGSTGTLESENIDLTNNNCQFICDGTANINGNINTQGSSHIYNSGEVTVKQSTILNSYNNTWVNEGKWTTNMWEFTAYSEDLINRCQLIVENRMTISPADGNATLKLDASSSVITKNFLMEKGYVRMGKDAILNVTNNANMNITNAWQGYSPGIYGPTSGWAILQAKKIKKGPVDSSVDNNSKYVTYGGNLIIAADTHFAQGSSGQYQMYYVLDNAKMVNSQNGATDINIPKSECSPGYGSDTPPTPVPEDPAMWYYYAFEDLGSIGDFDFNDVVLRVSAPSIEGKGEIQLCAAGGTLETTIYLGNEPLGKDGKYEVHELFGVSTATMVNTYNRTAKPYVTIGTYSGCNPALLELFVQVDDKGRSYTISPTTYNSGETPLSITVSGSTKTGQWIWPYERQRIDRAYPDFSKWVADKNYNIDWTIK